MFMANTPLSQYRRGEKRDRERRKAIKRMDTARAAREDAMLLTEEETEVDGA